MSSSDGSGSDTKQDPKYGSVEEVPVSGVGRWQPGEKRDALSQAVTRVELELSDAQIDAHKDAVGLAANTFATYVLARGLVDPVSQKGGDLADDGGRRAEFAQQFLDDFNEIIAEITGVSEDGSDGGGGSQDGAAGDEDFYFNVM